MHAAGAATRASLTRDLRGLGVAPGDTIIVHASVRSIGPIDAGIETLVGALLDAIGPSGTLVAYVDWDVSADEAYGPDQPVFDKRTSRAAREYGILPEAIRSWLGAVRSDNPDAGIAAIGTRAAWLCADHPLSYGYGETSPFAKLVSMGAKVLVLGAPLDTITLLHHAEHLAKVDGKRVIRYERKIGDGDRVTRVQIEEFGTSMPIVEGMPADAFASIARLVLEAGASRSGQVGRANSYLFDAAELVREGVRWLEAWSAGPGHRSR
jgi:aminoglycoside 3-N-acetyltransferase